MIEGALGLGLVGMVCALCMTAYLMGGWVRQRRPSLIFCGGFAMCFLIQAIGDVAQLLAHLMQSF